MSPDAGYQSFLDELEKLAADVNLGQWWENTGGPFLAKGGDHAEFRKMMNEAGIPEPAQKRFKRMADEKYSPGFNRREVTAREWKPEQSRWTGKGPEPANPAYKGRKQWVNATPKGVKNLRSHLRSPGDHPFVALGLTAGTLLGVGLGAATQKQYQDADKNKTPEWQGRLGSYTQGAATLGQAGGSLGRALGFLAEKPTRYQLAGIGAGVVAGVAAGEAKHQLSEWDAKKKGQRVAESGRSQDVKNVERNAQKTFAGHLVGAAAAAAPAGLISAGTHQWKDQQWMPAVAAAVNAAGMALSQKRHAASVYEHYQKALEDIAPKQKAASAPIPGSRAAKQEEVQAKKRMLIGAGGVVGAGLVSNGLLAATMHQAHAPGSSEDALMMNKLKETSKVPIRGTGAPGGFYASPTLAPRGMKVEKQVGLNPRVNAPSILAHELGHADIDANRFGRMAQNRYTMRAGGAAPLIGLAAGALTGMSDDEHVQQAGLAAPLLASAPQLAYEAGASVQGLRRMHGLGASKKQLLRGAGQLLPAFGTYAMQAGAGLAGAYGAQNGVAWARRSAANSDAKHAASAPTRGNFMMASDLPGWRQPNLNVSPLEKQSDMDLALGQDKDDKKQEREKESAFAEYLPYGPGDFKRSKYAMPFEARAEFVSELLKESAPMFHAKAAPKVSVPSIAQQAKPRGAGFGTGIAGAFKGHIGGTAPVDLGASPGSRG